MKWIIVVLAAACAVALETIYRKHEGSFDQIFLLSAPLALFVTYGVFKTMRDVDSLIGGMVVWSFFTALVRVGSTLFVLGENPTTPTWVAFGMIILAQVVIKIWR